MKQKKKKTERKKVAKEKETNERLIKDRIIRDIRTLFEQEEVYYNIKSVNNVWKKNLLNMKRMVIKTETFH